MVLVLTIFYAFIHNVWRRWKRQKLKKSRCTERVSGGRGEDYRMRMKIPILSCKVIRVVHLSNLTRTCSNHHQCIENPLMGFCPLLLLLLALPLDASCVLTVGDSDRTRRGQTTVLPRLLVRCLRVATKLEPDEDPALITAETGM